LSDKTETSGRITTMLPKWSARTIAVGGAIAAAALLLTTAGYHADQLSHPPGTIQSMGQDYQCDADSPLSKEQAQDRLGRLDGARLHLVGWVPLTHAVYADHRAADQVYVRFGARYFPCQVSRAALSNR
jgi:hypothetical protein